VGGCNFVRATPRLRWFGDLRSRSGQISNCSDCAETWGK